MSKLDDFKTLVAESSRDEYDEMDKMCFEWLREASKDYGVPGATARRLLDIAEELMQ